MRTDATWVLWTGTVGFDRSIGERIDAARAAGYGAISMSPREGVDREEAARGADAGIGIAVLDAVFSWLRPTDEIGLEGTNPLTVDEALRVAEAMHVPTVNAIALRGAPMPADEIAERFAAFCDRAAESGCRVHLEFAPHSAVPDVAAAWDVVRLAGRDNGGILFDSWHFSRGTHDFDALASVPGDRIFAAQISDGTAEPVGHWFDETMHRRLLPGEGAFDLVRIVRTLSSIGALALSGPEVISDALHERPAPEAAAIAGERLAAVYAQAGVAAPEPFGGP
jgi:sugar phosphate isomerase/epimerase